VKGKKTSAGGKKKKERIAKKMSLLVRRNRKGAESFGRPEGGENQGREEMSVAKA